MPRRGLVVVLGAVLAALILASTATSAQPGYTKIFSGTATGGVTWELSAKRTRVSGLPTLCLGLSTKTPGGFGFTNNGCGGGSLEAWNNVFPVTVGSPGEEPSSLVAGFAAAAARKARISFTDGKRMLVPVRLGPPSFRQALGVPIRFFVADALPVTSAEARWVAVLDAKGRLLGRTKLGQ